MDIGKAFTFAFDDEEWIVKILIAAAILAGGILLGILVIPAIVAGLLLAGYGVEITRRVIGRDPQVLPKWDNWGDLFVDGLKVAVISIVYALPIILIGLCLGIPAGIAAEDSQEVSAVLNAIMGCLNILWGIPMGLLLPAAIASFVAQDDLAAAFRFRDIFTLVRNHFATYLIVLVIGWVASLVGGLGILVCGIGLLVTGPYAGWITSHLYGQAYVEATSLAPEPTFEDLDNVA
ncbi:MAG: DUF4013 domain-containing protein [Anaerolineae bacterium]|jgi:hypothetical protein